MRVINDYSLHGLTSESKDISVQWLNDPVSSRVMEQFLKSDQISLKSKRKILYLLQGHFGRLGMDKYGSHWLELGWKEVADLKLKEIIAGEILSKEFEFRDSMYGKFLWRNFKLDLFKRRRPEWMELEKGVDKKKELFKEFY